LRPEGLPKSEILRSNQEFNEVLKSRVWFHCPWFTVYHKEADERKAGFAVSKRIRGVARRNTAKRRLRELYRRNKERFPKGHLVFMAHPPILTTTVPKLRAALDRIEEGA
jgi:ribonuclease P protein component